MRNFRTSKAIVVALLAMAWLPAAAVAAPPSAEVEALAADQGITSEQAQAALERQSNAPALENRAQVELGSAFGGVWIDNPDGATVKLGIAAEAPDALMARAIEVAASSGTAAEVVEVDHSFAELEAVVQWIVAGKKQVDDDPAHPLNAGIRTDRNLVSLGVPQDSVTEEQRQFIRKAKARFGYLLDVVSYEGEQETLACNYPFCDPPLRGGTRILHDPPGGEINLEPYCTGGFVSRGRGPNNYLFLLTAGHCWAQGTIWTRTANRTAKQLGPFHNAIFPWEGAQNADAGIIRVMDETYWKARSWVNVVAGGGLSTNPEYPIYGDANSIVGMQVCIAGSFYGYSTCGYVTEVNFNTNFTRSVLCAIPGDSGSPIFAANVAYGLLSGGREDCVTTYMNVRAAENLMNVDVTHAQP